MASGPMTSTFLLPLTMGAVAAVGSNRATGAFGVEVLVALAPLIAIQIMGLVYVKKTRAVRQPAEVILEDVIVDLDDMVVDLEEEQA